MQIYGTASEFSTVGFHFVSGQYKERWRRERVGPKEWQHYKKLPGRPEELGGMERNLGRPGAR
jgi:hypothetical protein